MESQLLAVLLVECMHKCSQSELVSKKSKINEFESAMSPNHPTPPPLPPLPTDPLSQAFVCSIPREWSLHARSGQLDLQDVWNLPGCLWFRSHLFY